MVDYQINVCISGSCHITWVMWHSGNARPLSLWYVYLECTDEDFLYVKQPPKPHWESEELYVLNTYTMKN